MRPEDASALAEEFRRRGLKSIARLIEAMESDPAEVQVGLCICTIAEVESLVQICDPYPYFIEILKILERPCEGNDTAARALEEACEEVIASFNDPGRMSIH